MKASNKLNNRIRRKKRVRSKVYGRNDKPRLTVFRSNQHIYAQLIDDDKGVTLISASDFDFRKLGSKKKAAGKSKEKAEGKSVSKNGSKTTATKEKMPKKAMAEKVGEELAKKAVGKKIKRVVFDRSGYRYHGIVRSLAEAARKGGLEF